MMLRNFLHIAYGIMFFLALTFGALQITPPHPTRTHVSDQMVSSCSVAFGSVVYVPFVDHYPSRGSVVASRPIALLLERRSPWILFSRFMLRRRSLILPHTGPSCVGTSIKRETFFFYCNALSSPTVFMEALMERSLLLVLQF